MTLVRFLIYLLIGYFLGLWLADGGIFSAQLSLTQWDNVWVWVWLLLWPFAITFKFIFWALIIIVIVLVIYAIMEKIL